MTDQHQDKADTWPALPCEAETIQLWMVSYLADLLRVPPDEIGVHEPFSELGITSKDALVLIGELEEALGRELPSTLLWEYPNIQALSQYLTQLGVVLETQPQATKDQSEESTIAVIGMACRFPAANNVREYWRLLEDGVDAISEVPGERWNTEGFDYQQPAPEKMNACWGGFLGQVTDFDYDFFGISPREASRMDPQQRLLLELAWEALEDAGLVPAELAGTPTSLYIGISSNDYSVIQLGLPSLIDANSGTGNARSIAANRISYLMDLRGESLAVDTACSSSLVAVHLACQSLRRGESDLALAGGVNLILSPELTNIFSQARMMAADGRCKTFDAAADGYVRGEGGGVVVLKRLSDALRDADPIVALIRGSAVNQDGRSNGLTAPSLLAQQELLERAMAAAEVEPERIGYVEAHGTGTALGDPIEVRALAAALGRKRRSDNALAIGSVKTNIGHLEAAAGIAGLIKVALMLRHRALPASLHFHQPNPHIPFATIPVKVQTQFAAWPEEQRPAIAGVSSFGFGGTNAHVIMEEAPGQTLPAVGPESPRWYLLPVSARTDEALRAMAEAYGEELRGGIGKGAPRLIDICHTAGARRSHYEHRLGCLARTREEMVTTLESYARREEVSGAVVGKVKSERTERPVFVFSGQGSEWERMGRGLLTEAVFGDVIKRCDEVIVGEAGWSLLEELEAGTRMGESRVLQPALYAVEVGLAALWRSWGIEPGAVVGHSIGEVAAAQVAGVMTLEEGVRLAMRRGVLMEADTNHGKMVSVALDSEEAAQALKGFERLVSIAAINGPRSTVLSGDSAALVAVCRSLTERKIPYLYLQVNHAFHSPHMERCAEALVKEIAWLNPGEAKLPIFSTVTGRRIEGCEFDANYWGRNLRESVRFKPVIGELALSHSAFLEVGAHPVLSGAVIQCMRQAGRTGKVFSSLRRHQDERREMLGSLGALYASGHRVNWKGLYPPSGRYVELPTYRFNRKRCWIEDKPKRRSIRPAMDSGAGKAEARRSDEWLYQLSWRAVNRRGTKPSAQSDVGPWVIFCDRGGVGPELARRLTALGQRCVQVFAAERFGTCDQGYEVNPANPEDFLQLMQSLAHEFSKGPSCRGVTHLWSLDATVVEETTDESLRADGRLGCGSVLHLV